MDIEEALSPQEAARLVVAQRAGADTSHLADTAPAASDEAPEPPTYTGKEGVERSQGFERMRVARPIPKESDEPIQSSDLSRQQAEPDPFPPAIQYLEQGGAHAGRPMADHLTVSADQASSDLQHYREQRALLETGADVLAIQQAVDELRKPDAPELHPNDVGATSEQAPAGDDEVVKLLESNPKLLAAINEQLGQHSAQASQVAQQ